MTPKKFAPFCRNPDCACARADKYACDTYHGEYDSAGVERCARCGNLRTAHPNEFKPGELVQINHAWFFGRVMGLLSGIDVLVRVVVNGRAQVFSIPSTKLSRLVNKAEVR